MNKVNQISNATKKNRYPEIFSEIKNILGNNVKEILSFGCSSGLECEALSNIYFTNSNITGYDICKDIVLQNSGKNTNNKIKYISDSKLLKQNSYDLIFCMSVLCVWPESMGLYSMNNFNESLTDIDKLLKVNGYLCIYNSKYLFTDSKISSKYIPIETNHKETGFVTKYSNNNVIKDYKYYLFKKIIF